MIDVVVLAFNEERNLPDCLESVRGLDCNVSVVDSGSTDRTVEIATAFGAAVVSHPFEGYGEQRNWAMGNLPLKSEWTLHLDADERLTPALAREISATVRNAPDGVAGYRLRRRTVFMGRWIRHGGHYPNYQLRLFRRGAGICEDRLYDQHFIVTGEVQSLTQDYIDVTGADLATWSARHVRWAGAEASELLREGAHDASQRVTPALSEGPIARRRWMRDRVYGRVPLFARALSYFIWRYFFRLGFLDGKEGLVFHLLQGFWYRFLVDAMLYERSRGLQENAHPGA